MHVKVKRIESLTKSLKERLDNIGTNTFARHFSKKQIEKRLSLVNEMHKKIEDSRIKKKNFIKNKKDGE